MTGDQPRGWWPQHLALGWINLSLTAPTIYIFIGLPLILRQHGWGGTEIGLLQLAGLPATLKFLLAGLIERFPLGRSSYRNWALLTIAGYAAMLLFLASLDIAGTPRWLLLSAIGATSLLATWADVPVNALAIDVLPRHERARAGAIRAAATSLAAILGGGLMLLAQMRWGWASAFGFLALCLGPALLLARLPRAAASPIGTSPSKASTPAGVRECLGYFTAGRRIWIALVLLYFPFIGAAWVYLKPIMLDQGFDAQRIAMIAGFGGGTVAALSSIGAGHLARRFGIAATLPIFAWGNCLSLFALFLATATQASFGIFAVVTFAVAVSMGASASALFGAMMDQARPGLAALDYGVQSTLFILGRTLVPIFAGVALDRLGQPGMVATLLVGSAAGLLLAWGFRRERASS